MTDPIEKQRPLLVWGTDNCKVYEAYFLCLSEGISCSEPVEGKEYTVFCAYLTRAIDPDLDAQLRALVSRVQVTLTRTTV